MPPVRTIEFKVTHAGLVPGSPQFAGVQGEHNATRVSFLLDTVLQTGYVYRIEYVDGRGNWDTTDLLTISDGAIAYDLPSAWTRNGGEAEIHLVASALDSEGKETQTYFSLAGKLYYEDKSADETGETKAGLTELIQDTHEAIDEANQATDNANEAADAANEAAGSVNEALSNTAEAIDGANAARDAANLAAQEAKEAAATAEEEAEAAHQITLAAQAAAGKADTAATAAQNAASAAQSAASAANTAAGTANTAAGTANAAVSAANAAAEAANEAADAANEAAESIADKVDTVDALPVYTMARSSDPTDCWQPTPGIAVPDTGPYTGMAIRAVWEEEWDASVPIWAFAGTEPVKPEGTYPAGAYILMWDGEAFQLQADMNTVKAGAIPVHTMALKTIGNGKWGATPAIEETGLENGTCIRAVWRNALNTKFPLEVGEREIPIRPEGIYPGGTYLLAYNADADIWTIQSLDMAYTDERAEQAADEAAEAHAAQVRRTYQPAWKRTATGCPVSVADAAEGADLSSLVLKGRTVVSGTPSPDAPVTITGVKPQTVAVTGKNLIPPKAASETINGVTCTVNADGSLTLNGTATAGTYFNFPFINIIPGIYTLSASPRLTNGVTAILRMRNTTKQLLYTSASSPSQTKQIGSKGEVYAYIAVSSGTTLTNFTVRIQLEVGSEATAYEPYHGQTITSDEVELYGDAHTVGKNLIPTFEEKLPVNGISVFNNADGSITLDGTATANTYFYFPDMMIKAGTYTLSTSANLAGGTSFVLRTRSGNVWLINIQAGSKSKTEAVSYSGAAQAYIAVASGTTVTNLTIYPQLEAGSEATAYEPYQGMTTALEDGDSLDLATGEVVRRWKRLELDGTEAWTAHSSGEEWYYALTLSDIAADCEGGATRQFASSHFVPRYTSNMDRIYIAGYGNALTIFYSGVSDHTAASFKTWLAAQKEAGTPVTVLYRLKKPEVVSGGAHSLAQPEGEMAISALGTRGETAEAVDTEALYTYRPDWDDVLNRLAALENLISEGDVTSAELAAHNTNESAHANLVIDGNIK